VHVFHPVLVRKKHGNYLTTTMFEQGYFVFIYVYFCQEDGASFFSILAEKCWSSECISRIPSMICPFKEVILVTALLLL